MLELTAILKEHGLKVTPQRLSIFKMLRNTCIHPSAETIYKALQEEHPTMSLATVYKTLDTFVQHGLVQQLNLGEDSYRYDADTSEHSHVQCINCKSVVDLPPLKHISDLRDEVHESTGFALSHEQLYFYGTCVKCQNANHS
ncbi:MAG: transcriptional repressor [Cellulosilyticum sp.]|nr:transcriptional repressor [Cellulosilyticum sp.]